MKKWLLTLVFVLILVPLLLVLGLSLVDLNQFKPKIEAQVSQQLGREVRIGGDLSISLYPWVGLQIEQVSIANAEGFGDTPFVEVAALGASVKLLPLLSKQVEVGTVRLQGARVDLQKNAAGVSNWADLSAPASESPEPAPTEAPAAKPAEQTDGSLPFALAVEKILLEDAQVRWRDAASGVDATVQNFNVMLNQVALDQAFPLTAAFTLKLAEPAVTLSPQLSASVQVDQSLQNIQLAGLELLLDAQGAAIPNAQQTLKLTAEVQADLANEQVQISQWAVSHDQAKLSGQAAASAWSSDLKVSLGWALAIDNLRAYLSTLGQAAPQTADANVLKAFKAKGQVLGQGASWQVKSLNAQLDDTQLSGQLSAKLGGALPALGFDLSIDALDADRYLPPESPSTAPAPSEASAESAPAPSSASDELPLPVDMLRQLDLKGALSIGQLKVKGYRVSQVQLPVSAQSGLIRAGKGQAQLYGGKTSLDLSLDVRGNTPKYHMAFDLAAIQASGLVQDALKKDLMSGVGDLSLNLSSQGQTVQALTKGLSGGLNFEFRDGAINGLNLAYDVRRLKALFKGQKLSADESVKRTDFSAFKTAAQIQQGVINVQDMALFTPFMRLNGSGNVDLPKEYLDMKLRVLLTETDEGQGGAALGDLKGLKASIPIRGHFADLQANFSQALLKGIEDNAKERLKAKAKAKLKAEEARAKARLKAEEDRLKAELEAKRQAEEQKLREKIEREKERAKEKLEEKLQDGLRKLLGG